MAVYPVAPGNPDYSSTGTTKYIPAIYSGLLIKKFYPTTLFGEIANTNYEGEIKSFGDTIYMRTRPTIETFSYKKGMVLPIQNPESPYVTMTVDQGEGFSVALDKVDEFQSNVKLMTEWANDATEQMKIVIDKKILANVYTQVAAKNTGANAGAISGGLTFSAAQVSAQTNPENWLLRKIVEAGQILDEQNIPENDRWFILPAWAATYIKLSDLKATYITGDGTSTYRNGKIGQIDRFKIFVSNNVYVDGSGYSQCLFGHSLGLTFATQITESRIIDNPFAFGKLLQGLQVYGYKVTNPEALGVLPIKP